MTVKQGKRPRPDNGPAPTAGFRPAPELRASIERWAEGQPGRPALAEAISRLVELGLTVGASGARRGEGRTQRAREVAGNALDHMSDTTASTHD